MKKDRVLPLIAIVVSVVAIGIALYRSFHLDWDAIMFAVAMLSGLVVLLIGWNIYTILDVKKLEDRIREDLRDMSDRYEEDKNSLIKVQKILMDEIYHAANNTYRSQLMMIENNDVKNDDYLYVFFSICSIEMFCALEEFDRANNQISLAAKRLPSNTIIDTKSRRDLIRGLDRLKNEYELLDTEELIRLVDVWSHEDLA